MNNPLQFVQMMRNPQAFMENALKQNPNLKNNEPLMNAFNAMQNGNPQEAEKIARNVCSQRGVNPMEMISNIKNMMRMQ